MFRLFFAIRVYLQSSCFYKFVSATIEIVSPNVFSSFGYFYQVLARLSPNRLLRIKFLCAFAKVSEKFYPQQPSLAWPSSMALREADVAVANGSSVAAPAHKNHLIMRKLVKNFMRSSLH